MLLHKRGNPLFFCNHAGSGQPKHSGADIDDPGIPAHQLNEQSAAPDYNRHANQQSQHNQYNIVVGCPGNCDHIIQPHGRVSDDNGPHRRP
ncbi:hypothetical protein D3C75_896910 [compost metagenome]